MDARNRRLYWVYRAMLKRCGLIDGASKRHIDRYEKRGITVCDEWAKSWHAFRDWAWENGYGDGLQIDRIDNDGSYSPDNCRWVSGTRNMRNTSQTFPVIARRLIDGMEIRFESEADAAEFMSIPKSSIRDCVNGKQTQTHGFEWSKDNRRAERTWHDFSDELPPAGASVLCRGKNGALYVGKPVTFKGNGTRKVWVPRGDQYRTPEKWTEIEA